MKDSKKVFYGGNMGFKDILIHLDEAKSCSTRLNIAIRLAKQHHARLTGLYVTTHPSYESSYTNNEIRATIAKSSFMQKIEEANLVADFQSIDWSVTGVTVTEIITMYSRTFDLVIVGQTDSTSPLPNIPADMPEQLVLKTGRPVLIVPFVGHFKTCGENIMLAWKAGRESVRALNDALPLMIKANQVEIFTTVPLTNDGPPDHRCDALCDHLCRYNIVVRHSHIVETGIPIGDLIINRISDTGTDLLVMGSFTNTLSNKPKLGVVASHLLKQMTVPVLMSH
jgi:nucleotide-binding universal stress UspA family protein